MTSPKTLMGSGEMFYNVTGTIVGVTSLYCHATKLSGMELTSVHKEVQVGIFIFSMKNLLLKCYASRMYGNRNIRSEKCTVTEMSGQ